MIIREHSRVVVLLKNREYWRRRFEAIEKVVVKEGLEYNARLEKEYYKAMKSIESDIATWYQRFANNNEIDIGEAKRLLNTKELKEFRWSVEDYIKHGEENTIAEEWKKELENASAKVHITRLELLEVQLQQEVEKLYGNQLDDVDRLTKSIYQDTYYRSAFEIQKGFNVGWNLQRFNEKQLQHVIETPWTLDKMTFSDRIWKRKDELLKTVRTELSQTIIRGDPPDKAIRTLAKKLEVDKYKAGRLIMTESAYFASKAQKQCFNDLDVEKYEILATLDSHTSEICQELDGQVREMKDYEEGVTAPPFHPWCRTTTIPYFEDSKDGERAARDPYTGEVFYVPSNMTYKEWKETYLVDETTQLNSNNNADKIKNISSVSNATNVVQAKEMLTDVIGFEKVGYTFNAVDDDLIISNTNQLLKLEKKFEVVRQSNSRIQSVSNGDAIAYVRSKIINPTEQELSLSPMYFFDKNELEKVQEEAVKSRWCMPCDMSSEELQVYAVTHEFGHMLQHILIKQKYEQNGWTLATAKDFIDISKKTKDAKFKWYIECNKEVQEECFNEICEIARDNNDKFNLDENLSMYGKSDKSEFFAEVFANSQLSKPNELGKAMNIWLEKKGLIK